MLVALAASVVALQPGREVGRRSPAVLAPRLLASKSFEASRTTLVRAYGRLPLRFEANVGQVKGDRSSAEMVRFVSRAPGYALFLTPQEAALAVGQDPVGRESSLPSRLTRTGLVLPVPDAHSASQPASPAVLRMRLPGSNQTAKVSGEDELPGKTHYFTGSSPSGWRTNVPNYSKVRYAQIYPGVDLVYYGREQQLEYDFVVSPGADPRSIRLKIAGAPLTAKADGKGSKRAGLRVDRHGDLLVQTDHGEVRWLKPVAYQPGVTFRGTESVPRLPNPLPGRVDVRYVLKLSGEIGFAVGAYDRTRPLVIDPVLSYSTYLGGSSGADYGQALAVDAAGSAYVTGQTCSTDFPASGGAQTAVGGNCDAFVTKLTPDGSDLVYSTYLGGSGSDGGFGIAVDAGGSAYVTGFTCSTDFPTASPIQANAGGGCDAFVTKVSPEGNALIYSTYLGGAGSDVGQGISLDPAANAYVAGVTLSSNFPTTAGAFQPKFSGGACGALGAFACPDAFITKVSASGAALAYSTYLGGSSVDSAQGITVDASGDAYVTGFTSSQDFPTVNPFQPSCDNCTNSVLNPGVSFDAFVTKLNPAGSGLVFSTYLGGSLMDVGLGIAVDSAGSPYVTGYTASNDFPTVAPIQAAKGGADDAFVAKLSPAGNALVYSTYLGGGGSDFGNGIAVDSSGSAYVAGATFSEDFPITDAFQPELDGGSDAFLTKLDPAGSAWTYSSFLGGRSGDQGLGVAVDASGNAYLTGITNSADFPASSIAFQTTCEGTTNVPCMGGAKVFVTKVNPQDVPGIALSSLNIDFGSYPVGVSSPFQAVTLRNTGSQVLEIRKIFAVSTRYFTQTNDCGSSLEPGATCTISLAFTPAAPGRVIGFLVVTDNASPKGLQLVKLVGSGG